MKKMLLLLAMVFQLSIVSGQNNQDTRHQSCAPKISDTDWYNSSKKAPLFKGLDGINFEISTNSPEARKYFLQGLMLSYGFNHAEAARSFYETIRQDSTCAMGYWGYALVLGPNYNSAMEDDNIERAYTAVQKALQLSEENTGKERDLIVALSKRYKEDPGPSRTQLDINYANAMREVHQKYPDDDNLAVLYVESLMDLHPWDLWEKNGEPKPWTPEIVGTLETILKRSPEHAGAAHFYIHAVEASHTPERALPQADLLRDLVPGAGHLVHMPCHIYIRTGKYHEGTLANLRAVKVDGDYVETCHAYGVYPLAYFPHNYHFMAATATLEGNKEIAMMASQKVHELTDKTVMEMPGWTTLQHYYTIPYYVMVKFGMWDEIEKERMPAAGLKYPVAILHYAKGMAALGKGNVSLAEEHLEKLSKVASDPALKDFSIWEINSADDILYIAENVLQGEILAKKKLYDQAISYLEKAVAGEDRLNYNEPPDWFFSVRHNLGAVLLESGQFAKAKEVYLEDLKNYRDNGWALIGLTEALKSLGEEENAMATQQKFDKAWQFSDTPIHASRIL